MIPAEEAATCLRSKNVEGGRSLA